MRSISGFRLAETVGKFGPFDGQLFLADYSLSIIVRVTIEEVNACGRCVVIPFAKALPRDT